MSAPTTIQDRPAPPADGRAAAEEWVAAFREGWRAPTGPEAFADHFEPLLDPGIRLVQPQMPTIVGRRAFRERFARSLFDLVPDLRGEVERWAVGDDVAYIELTLTGTLGGRPVTWRVCDRVSLRDGLAVERESYLDPTPVIRAVATRPRAWLPFLRARGADFIHRNNRRTAK